MKLIDQETALALDIGEKSDNADSGYLVHGRFVDGSTPISVQLSVKDFLRIQTMVIASELKLERSRCFELRRFLPELTETRKHLVEAIWKARGLKP